MGAVLEPLVKTHPDVMDIWRDLEGIDFGETTDMCYYCGEPASVVCRGKTHEEPWHLCTKHVARRNPNPLCVDCGKQVPIRRKR